MTPAPTTATSARPEIRRSASSGRSSSSQYELSMSAMLTLRHHRPVDAVCLANGSGKLELDKRRCQPCRIQIR